MLKIEIRNYALTNLGNKPYSICTYLGVTAFDFTINMLRQLLCHSSSFLHTGRWTSLFLLAWPSSSHFFRNLPVVNDKSKAKYVGGNREVFCYAIKKNGQAGTFPKRCQIQIHCSDVIISTFKCTNFPVGSV